MEKELGNRFMRNLRSNVEKGLICQRNVKAWTKQRVQPVKENVNLMTFNQGTELQGFEGVSNPIFVFFVKNLIVVLLKLKFHF